MNLYHFFSLNFVPVVLPCVGVLRDLHFWIKLSWSIAHLRVKIKLYNRRKNVTNSKCPADLFYPLIRDIYFPSKKQKESRMFCSWSRQILCFVLSFLIKSQLNLEKIAQCSLLGSNHFSFVSKREWKSNH